MHYKGEWAGQPFRLAPWQAFLVGSLFGWQRRIRRAAPGCAGSGSPSTRSARKNGKSFLAAAIALLLAFFDHEAGAEVYTAATKKEQARIVFDAAKAIVARTPYQLEFDPPSGPLGRLSGRAGSAPRRGVHLLSPL